MNRVSVIIPTYGNNTNPERAIDSVFSQDYLQVEVIVVDDNGEGTKQQKKNQIIFEKYKGNKAFKYIVCKDNNGGSTARNIGVKASSGEYVCFLDDDDVFSNKDKLRLQIEASKNLDMTWAGTYSSTNIYNDKEFIRKITAKYSGNIVEMYLSDKIEIGTGALIIRRSAYESVGGFNESFIRHQDWEFFARIFDKFKILAVPEASYDRCYKPNINRRPIEIRIQYMNKFTSFMADEIKSISNHKVNRILKKKYFPIIFSLIREKKFRQAKLLFKENSFGINEVINMGFLFILYVYKRIRFGTHF